MNKEKFLTELGKRLSILNEKEKQDIINEYKDTIEEKIKHGQKEADAVKDFGDMDELVDEILSAYKIDPKYNKETDLKKIISDSEKLIKEGADKLATETRKLADNFKNNQDINLSLVFEILIKVFICLILIGMIRIPFTLFIHLGNSIFETLFSPIDSVVKALWFVFLGVIYTITIILIITSMFKQYFKNNNEKTLKSNKNKVNNIYEKDKKDNQDIKKSGQTLTSILMIVVKVWIIIFVVIPLVFASSGFIGATLVSIYYWIQGIDLLGLTLLLSGISLIFIWFTKIITNVLQEKKALSIYLLISGIALSIAGGFLFANMIMSIEYLNVIPEDYNLNTFENTYTTDKKVYIESHHNSNIVKKEDELMEDNTFKINAHYSQTIYDFKINQTDNYMFNEEDCEENDLCGRYNYFSIYPEEKDEIKIAKMNYKILINDLKNKKIHNYSKLYTPEIEITANSKTLNLIEID